MQVLVPVKAYLKKLTLFKSLISGYVQVFNVTIKIINEHMRIDPWTKFAILIHNPQRIWKKYNCMPQSPVSSHARDMIRL